MWTPALGCNKYKWRKEMSDEEFLKAIYNVAQKMLGRRITSEEKSKLIKKFNSESGNAFERAKIAIKEVTGKPVPETFLLLEAEGAINELANLVAELHATAEEWIKDE